MKRNSQLRTRTKHLAVKIKNVPHFTITSYIMFMFTDDDKLKKSI